MASRVNDSDEVTIAASRSMRRSALGLVVISITTSTTPAIGQAAQEPVSPQVQEKGVDLLQKKPLVPWKPGDPVRVVPDLREDSDAPVTGAAIEMLPPEPLPPGVAPAIIPDLAGQNVKDLPKAVPYELGDPVRIVPDLKEGGVED